MFLLKGHEDLRQDERVMQLFGLVNTLLLNDPVSIMLSYPKTQHLHYDSIVGHIPSKLNNSTIRGHTVKYQ